MSVNLVTRAVELLCDNYIFPDKAKEAAAAINRRLAAGEYEGLDEAGLGERLTTELYEVCRDKHLRVRVRDASMADALSEAELEQAWQEQLRLTNYGIARVERLDGNVGLLDLRAVTSAWLPGDRYLDRPVYVLTSDATFSGGEELCYNLKTQGRAVLIGETTRGGAHPTDAFPITPSFEITVPIARSVNPVTGGNWEGTGVEPNIAAPASEAFDLAYRKALRHVLTTSTSPAVLAEARAVLG